MTKPCLHVLLVAATLCVQAPVRANVFDGEQIPYALKNRPQVPIDVQRRPSALEEFIKPVTTGAAYVVPVPLHGIRIPGLTSKTVDTLGFNNFVVINNLKNARMADIYRDNRNNGKANFVTTDCVLHPYLAFTNRVLADTAEQYMAADLRLLLQAMLEQSAIDFNGTDDAEVRADLEKNIAYLGVAIKLLDPKYEMLNIGHATTLVEHDLRNITAGNKGFSDIFDREEDFKVFRPVGWYKSSEKLGNFYRAREWISRMAFPISDITIGGTGGKSNSFRRSVLLFRALELARVDGQPALDFYDRVLKELSLLGPQPNSWRDRVLYPSDYKLTFKNNANNLRDTLNGLSQPFYRTKLLLAVRRQKPMNLGSASIFEMEDSSSQKETTAIFRLLPIIGDPEIAWMQNTAKIYPTDQEGGTWWPASLADLSAWGSGHAGNLLLQNTVSLDPGLNRTYPDLHHSIMERTAAGQMQPIASRRWNLFAHYFKPFPDSVQPSLRGEMWLTHRLESAFAAWLDSVNCLAPRPVPGAATNTMSTDTPSATAPTAKPEAAITLATAKPTPAISKPTAATAASPTTAKAPAQGPVAAPVAAPALEPDQSDPTAVPSSAFQGQLTSRKHPTGQSATALGQSAAAQGHAVIPAQTAKATLTTPVVPAQAPKAIPAQTTTAPAATPRHAASTTPPTTARQSTSATAATTAAAAVDNRKPGPTSYHFLEPDAPMFAQIKADATTLMQTLTELGYLQTYQKHRFNDFIRLATRLQGIAEVQASGRPLSPADRGLLGNIDAVLDKVDVPLPTVMNFPGGQTADPRFKQHPGAGFNLALGRPGLLHVLIQNPRTQDWTLARGAVYSLYEFAGEPVTAEQWQRTLDYNTQRSPAWTRQFDILQPRQTPQQEEEQSRRPPQTANSVNAD